jgi:hypothetical protein
VFQISKVSSTSQQYDQIISVSRKLFENKTQDYGTAWRILRVSSLTDQIFIKAQRIRTLQINGISKIDESIVDEFIGILNYSIMAIIQLHESQDTVLEWSVDKALDEFDKQVSITKELMQNKNHDYGEAWREMRVSSLTDLILMKLLRIKQIEDNQGKTLVSEGVESGFRDMVNYSVFALIHLTLES